MNRKFVVIEQTEYKETHTADFSQCIGVYNNYFTALGKAYATLDERQEDTKNDKKEKYIVTLPESLEGDTGVIIEGYFESDTYKTLMLIYFLDGEIN